VPTSFAEHALYYSLNPVRLADTALARAVPGTDEGATAHEGFAALADRLGPERVVLFRNLTPPGLASAGPGWLVLRGLVPGLQPLHGHHGLPFLGGPLWSPRGLRDWGDIPPHPFA